MTSRFDRLAREHHIADSAQEIGEILTVNFAKKHGMKVDRAQPLHAERWSRDHWNTDLVLDVQTESLAIDLHTDDPKRLYLRASSSSTDNGEVTARTSSLATCWFAVLAGCPADLASGICERFTASGVHRIGCSLFSS